MKPFNFVFLFCRKGALFSHSITIYVWCKTLNNIVRQSKQKFFLYLVKILLFWTFALLLFGLLQIGLFFV